MSFDPRKWSMKRRLLVPGFVLAVVLTIFFAGRLFFFTLYWSDPAHQDQSLQGWMTPRYIGHSWQISPEYIAHSLDLDALLNGERRRITLSEIAKERGQTLTQITTELDTAIAAFRANHD